MTTPPIVGTRGILVLKVKSSKAGDASTSEGKEMSVQTAYERTRVEKGVLASEGEGSDVGSDLA